jgi:predicted DNA-binding transcriptional regulator YafY
MDRSKTQFSRLIELDRLIRTGRHPNCRGFAADWEVSQKTVQRDIDYLRDQLGAPVEYDRSRNGFRYTDSNWFLPAVSLSEGDFLTLLLAGRVMEAYRGVPVAERLGQVFAKLSALLPDRLTLNPELVYSGFSFTSPPSKAITTDIWTAVIRGLLARRALNISYRSFEAKRSKLRQIRPYHVANLQGEWYVFGHCERSGTVLQFALARIRSAELTDDVFEIPADFDAGELLSNAFARFAGSGESQKVCIRFDKSVAEWIRERVWHPRQKLKTLKTGAVELTFPAAGLFEVMRWTMAWGRAARVVEPRELRGWIKEEIAAMRKVYG